MISTRRLTYKHGSHCRENGSRLTLHLHFDSYMPSTFSSDDVSEEYNHEPPAVLDLDNRMDI
jgi:hypothetical protein